MGAEGAADIEARGGRGPGPVRRLGEAEHGVWVRVGEERERSRAQFRDARGFVQGRVVEGYYRRVFISAVIVGKMSVFGVD